MSDFNKTPSYFNNTEAFEKYLGQTSYYLALQNAVEKIISISGAKKILELGSATGATTIKMAQRFPDATFCGIDMREDVVKIAYNEAVRREINNITFETEDMYAFTQNALDYNLIYLLYSFHHILDPIENKISFLANTYKNMRPGSYLCIAETFIPEYATSLTDKNAILKLWNQRKDEGGVSTFWKALTSLGPSELQFASQVAEYSSKNEYFAGELVALRQDEYLIKRSWLSHEGEKAGFKIVLNQPVNALGDAVVLFIKE